MKKVSLLLFVLLGILVSACKDKSTETTKAEPRYLTMKIELSDRILTTCNQRSTNRRDSSSGKRHDY